MDDEKIINDNKKINNYFGKLLKSKSLLLDILKTPIKMESVEKVNKKNATYILFLRKKHIKEFSLSNYHNKDHINKSINIEGMREYLYEILQNKGELPIKYKYSNQKIGRIFTTKDSLQRLPSNIKNYITDGIYDDLDMINAHPSIILLLGDIANLETPTLNEYVNKRQLFLDKNHLTKKDIIIKGCYTDVIDNEVIGKERALYDDIRLVRDYYYREQELRYVFGMSDRELEKLKKEVATKKRGRPKANEEEEREKIEKKINNIKSSFLSQLLGYIENKIVNYVVNKNNLDMNVNFFDGFLIEKDKVDVKTLNETTKNIGIKWSKKPMTYNIEEGRDEFNYKNCMVYNQYKEEFEKNNFIVKYPYQLITLDEKGDHTTVSPDAFKLANSNVKVQLLQSLGTSMNKEIKIGKFINEWIDDCERKTYDITDYIPYTCRESKEYLIESKLVPKNAFNVFNGFPRNYVNETGREKFKKELDFMINEFIFHIVCDDCKIKFDYLMKYVGHMIQKPREKPQIAICLFAGQGLGKGVFCNLVKGLIESDPKKYKHTFISQGCPQSTVFCRFNSCISNKILVVLNEFGKRDYINCVDKLKALITDDEKHIERKNIDGHTCEHNYTRLFIVSDKDCPMSLSTEERRYFILKLSSDWKNTKSKYKDVTDLFNNDDFMDCLFSYFMDYDISTFEIGKRGMPNTQEQSQLVEDNVKPIYYFLKEKFVDNYELYENNLQKVKKWDNRNGLIIENSKGSYTLMKEFKKWLSDNNYKAECNWNTEKTRQQLRDTVGVYGYGTGWKFRMGKNKKVTSCVFICFDELITEMDRIMPSRKNDKISDESVDETKVIKNSSDDEKKYICTSSDSDTEIFN